MSDMTKNTVTWHNWVHNYFYKGKTGSVYIMVLLFIISLVELTANRVAFFSFFGTLFMVIISYGVFTDLVAHLWWSGYDSGINYKQFLHEILGGRTHDIYGILVFAGITIWLTVEKIITDYMAIILLILITIVLFELTKTKFYH